MFFILDASQDEEKTLQTVKSILPNVLSRSFNCQQKARFKVDVRL